MRIFIFAITALLLIATNVFSTTLPNESLEDYKIRYQEEFKPPQTTCGDGLCEGTEFETCVQDCKTTEVINESIIIESNKLTAKNFNFKIVIAVGISAITALVVIFYILRKKKSHISEIWDELGISKDYFQRIEAYIIKQINNDFQAEEIKKVLVNAGHNTNVIDKIFEHIKK